MHHITLGVSQVTFQLQLSSSLYFELGQDIMVRMVQLRILTWEDLAPSQGGTWGSQGLRWQHRGQPPAAAITACQTGHVQHPQALQSLTAASGKAFSLTSCFHRKPEEMLETFLEAAGSLRRICGAARSYMMLQVSRGKGVGSREQWAAARRDNNLLSWPREVHSPRPQLLPAFESLFPLGYEWLQKYI